MIFQNPLAALNMLMRVSAQTAKTDENLDYSNHPGLGVVKEMADKVAVMYAGLTQIPTLCQFCCKCPERAVVFRTAPHRLKR